MPDKKPIENKNEHVDKIIKSVILVNSWSVNITMAPF